jgi:iron complex outermembrane receptor protein
VRLALATQVSTAALLACGVITPGAAFAQAAPAPDGIAVEELVVTGTSIRGVAPVGSNLMAVGREAIENTSAQTVQQILKTIPAVTGAGAVGQGQAATSYYSPTIHQLGSSASNSTLVLVDGHRFSLGGQPHPLSDPNIIAPIALERVEVLAEGASSVYGSDAVAGVINFITRRNFDGFQVSGQAGFGDSYRTYNLGALWGERWDRGSVMLAYNFSHRDALANSDRDFLRQDQRWRGGNNFQSFACSPATVQPQGISGIYLSPTAATTVANTAANAPCDLSVYSDLIPQEVRHNLFAKVEYQVTDNLTIGLDGAFSDRENEQRSARGTVTATVFRTGPQANPFYVNPPGVLPGTTAGDRQTVRFSADDLLGPGALSKDGARNYYVSGHAEYRFGRDFRLTALALAGRDDSYTESIGTLCGSCASLALNGTTNTGGSLTQASIPGTNILIQNLPLTAANALDVWNPTATNRTSAAVRARLTDSNQISRFFHRIEQARIGIDGPLFQLPGGAVRFAAGAEYISYGLEVDRTRPNNTGPASSGSERLQLDLGRNVKSAYAELLIPIVGEDNAIPLVRTLQLNLSGRHDDYSDVGATTNPKIGANWEVVRGLRLKGNWSKSFVAPAISSLGDASRGGLASFSGYGAQDSGAINVPIANYPLAAQLPGCTAPGQVTCQISSTTVPGISFNNGNPDLEPQKGSGWSVGFELTPTGIPGLRLQATLFNNRFRGGVTSPNLATVINTAGLNHLLTIYPQGATAAQIAAVVGSAPQNSPLPPIVYFIRNGQQQNVVNLDIQGIDMDGEYSFTTDYGTFKIGAYVSRFTKFDQNIGGGPTFSVLNTTGFNETFPSIKTQARLNLGWSLAGFSAEVFANYIGAYRNWSTTTVAPLTRDANGNPNGGGDKVKANTLIDLNLAYDISDGGRLGQSQVYLDVTNLFDQTAPFYNSAAGYDRYAASPLGRVVTVGLRATW